MVRQRIGLRKSGLDVRFGSKADMCNAQAHVRFTPNSDRESGHGRRTRRPDQTRACRAVGGGGLDCELYAQIRGIILHYA
jgi:hypothetical protein